MADVQPTAPQPAAGTPAAPPAEAPASSTAQALGSATYEIIRQRLQTQGAALRERMNQLDARRQQVFGSIEFKLLQADRIVTAHNCIPRDMVQLGHGRFLFGFNVQFGLKKEIELSDVFAVYQRDEEGGTFKEDSLEILDDKQFSPSMCMGICGWYIHICPKGPHIDRVLAAWDLQLLTVKTKREVYCCILEKLGD
jgi:hypothetical protein